MLGWLARDRTSALHILSCQDIPRIRRVLLGWNELSLFSCLAYVVHVSQPYISVLTTQALCTTILVFTVSLGLFHTREVRQASVVAAFPILLPISVSKERLSVMVEPMFSDIELIVIDGDGWQFHCILPWDVYLLQTDG